MKCFFGFSHPYNFLNQPNIRCLLCKLYVFLKKYNFLQKSTCFFFDPCYNEYQFGSLVKRLRRRPLTAKTGVRFPYELLTVLVTVQLHDINLYGSLVKRLRRRPLTAKTGVRFPYELLTVFSNSPTRKKNHVSSDSFLFSMITPISSTSDHQPLPPPY